MSTPLKRKSIDIGIVGNKSYGKTITMTALGFFFYILGYKIFSNYWVKYPHVLIQTVQDIKNIYSYSQAQPKIMLMEDFERWVNSRLASTPLNIAIGQMTMDNGKNNTSLIWTSKRSAIIDLSIRDTTDFFIETHMIMPFRPDLSSLPISDEVKNELETLLINYMAKDFEKLFVNLDIFDPNLKPQDTQYLTNLKFFGELYNTQEIIKNIKI